MEQKLYVNKQGFTVQVVGNEASRVITFVAQSGGFAKTLPHADFFREFSVFTVPAYTSRDATFEHFDVGVSIAAWSNGLRWNGWAMPYFTFEQGLEVIKFFPELHFDAARDAFVWVDGDEDEVYSGATIDTDFGPIKAYPIGTGS